MHHKVARRAVKTERRYKSAHLHEARVRAQRPLTPVFATRLRRRQGRVSKGGRSTGSAKGPPPHSARFSRTACCLGGAALGRSRSSVGRRRSWAATDSGRRAGQEQGYVARRARKVGPRVGVKVHL
jgi:hypothetical protein